MHRVLHRRGFLRLLRRLHLLHVYRVLLGGRGEDKISTWGIR